MSTQWGKHILHTVKLNKQRWLNISQQTPNLLWHIVVQGQKSMAVGVPDDFPCKWYREEILSLVADEDLEHFSYAILSEDAAHGWSMEFRIGPPPALRCSLWAPLIDEREIHVLEWINGEVKLAIWRGMQVILKVGTSPHIDENHVVAAQSEAYRFLQNTDLTPKFHGHLVRDGVVIGFVIEALSGRNPALTREDREACEEAALKLHATGTFHSDLNKDNMIITQDGVRFIDMQLVYPSTEEHVLRDVARVFDDEITTFPEPSETPGAMWMDGSVANWERYRASDIEIHGEPPLLPTVRKLYERDENQWSRALLIPYIPGPYKPWNPYDLVPPSTIEGFSREPSCFPHWQFLSPQYLAFPVNITPPGVKQNSMTQFLIDTGAFEDWSSRSCSPDCNAFPEASQSS